jgi:protein involved in polysaccharide export with SLBB domain
MEVKEKNLKALCSQFVRLSFALLLWLPVCVLFFTLPVFAQQAGLDDLGNQTPRLMLALSTADYPATPGDVYNLSYHAGVNGNGASAVSIPLVLDAEYQLKVQNMGTINARNKTYLQIRREVENLVSQNYPMAGPTLTLVRMGNFTVLVTGETANAGNRDVDGLTRVSALLSSLTGRASIRFIRVTRSDGTTRTYDLFAATRSGDLSQNPYVSPGDRIVIPPAGRIVTLSGEVFRPGTYELLPGEELESLIAYYGNGFTLDAAPEKITLIRAGKDTTAPRELRSLSWDNGREIALEDRDQVAVENRNANRRAVFFEGAVFSVAENEELRGQDERTRAVTRIPYYFSPGETLGRAARNVRGYFTDVSDLTAAYLLRGAEQRAVNLEQFLYQDDASGDIVLESGDVIVVPYRLFYMITGEVNTAGNRPLNSLTRLSALLTDLTAKASSRLVTVQSGNAAPVVYDLFKARRFGDLSQDPYIRPGDTILVHPAGRKVALSGEVFRPGTHELLPGEELESLIAYYGDGFTLDAAPEKITLARAGKDTTAPRELRSLSWDNDRETALEDGDQVTVENRNANRRAVFFEGAVFSIAEDEDLKDRDERTRAVTRIPYYFHPGETLGRAVRNVRGYFTDVSDLTAAYLLRGNEQMAADLERFLYQDDTTEDIPLESGDVIVVPYRLFYTITGEVNTAGNRPLNSLTRLSALLTDLTAKASSRLVTVQSGTAGPVAYDLFQARRFGTLSQDPYIRPGDKIVVRPAGRKVGIAGEVFRPGTYELLPGEELESLIDYYSDGFTLDAAPEKITLARAGKDATAPRELRSLSWDKDKEIALEDGDQVTVENRNANRQAVFFEGAVFSVAEDEELKDRDERIRAVTRLPYYFSPGETLSRAARSIRGYFTDVSDLAAAYLLRGAEQIAANLERFLYRNDMTEDISLESGDVIVIPYRLFYTITGEVSAAGSRPLNSLTRLSSLLTDLTDKASSRLVTVQSGTAGPVVYDLFQARRFGDSSQDPYVRPGDRIVIHPAGRKVSIAGEVFRSGTYELLPGEELRSLVEYYGDGFTLAADPSRIRLTRISAEAAGETKIFPYAGNAAVVLEDRDVINVGNKAAARPVAFFEGALSQGTAAVEQTGAAIEGTAKMEYPFYEGETLGSATRAIAGRFTASSDLAKAYVIRNEKQIPVDLSRHLYYNDFSRDLTLENGDIVVIPFRQYFVLVSGAVKLPGRYPYVPDRLADYYVTLAGGRDELLNNGRGIRVTDMNEKTGSLRADAVIMPETMIWVPTNRFTAYFNQYGPVLTAILSIVSTVITIFAITGNL